MRHRSLVLASVLLVAIVAIPGSLLAGGPPSFAFEAPGGAAGSSGSSPVLIVHAFSCHAPTDAAVRASADEIVDAAHQLSRGQRHLTLA